MTHYLVDYENVHENGMKGIRGLTGDCTVHIFYTQNACRIKMDSLIVPDNVLLHFVQVSAGKQQADMHIISYLGYLLGKDRAEETYVIVSMDRDYDKTISFWNNRENSGKHISRQECIGLIVSDKPLQMKETRILPKPSPDGNTEVRFNKQAENAHKHTQEATYSKARIASETLGRMTLSAIIGSNKAPYGICIVDDYDNSAFIAGNISSADGDEIKILQQYPQLADIDVLAAGHYGEGDASSFAFVQYLNPGCCVVPGTQLVNENSFTGTRSEQQNNIFYASGMTVSAVLGDVLNIECRTCSTDTGEILNQTYNVYPIEEESGASPDPNITEESKQEVEDLCREKAYLSRAAFVTA